MDLDGTWNRPKPGSGAALPPFRPSLGLSRTRFTRRIGVSLLTVDVDHDEQRAVLYRDGVQEATATMPVRFPVEGGVIEVSASLHGIRRLHYVRGDGSAERLEPAPGTPEHGRATLARRHPGLSRAIAVAAVLVLAVDLLLLAPQALEFVTHLDVWPDDLFVFTSPIVLHPGLNIGLTLAGALAATERALTFRHHRLLDAETSWIDT